LGTVDDELGHIYLRNLFWYFNCFKYWIFCC